MKYILQYVLVGELARRVHSGKYMGTMKYVQIVNFPSIIEMFIICRWSKRVIQKASFIKRYYEDSDDTLRFCYNSPLVFLTDNYY